MEGVTRSILLVEDEAIIALHEKTMLERHGYLVTVVHSGELAIESLTRAPEIDLILMDIDLGRGMDGTETAEAILRERDVPIVFLSSHTEPEVVEKTEGITSYGYILKNSGETVLLASLRMAFRLFEAKQEAREHERRTREASEQLEEIVRQADERFKLMFDRGPLGYQPHGVVTDESLQHKLIANIADVIVIIDGDGINRYKSPNVERLFGWKPSELVGETAWEKVHPDDRRAVTGLFATLIATPGEAGTVECRYLCRDASYRWIEFTGTSMITDPDIRGILGSYRDVTRRRRAQDALHASVYELKKSQEVANVGNWVWHIADGRLEWSDQMYRIFGIEKEGFPGDLADVIASSIHPDDRPKVEESNAAVINRASPIPVEYRVIRPDGEERIVWAEAGELEIDRNNKPQLLRGVVLDITERKRMEESLRKSQSILAKSELLAGSGGWEWDIPSDVFTLSPGWRRIHGCREEVLSREDLMRLAHPDDRGEIAEALERAARDHAPYNIEHRIIRKDTGEVRTVHALGEVLLDAGGQLVKILGAVLDVTEHKRKQESIARLVQEKELLLRETHHRVKNSFLTVESLLNLQAARASSPDLVGALTEAESRVMSMRVLYEKLLESERYSHVGARHYIEDVAQSVLSGYESSRRGRLETQIEDLELHPSAVFPVGAIVAELVTNSLKYGQSDVSSPLGSVIGVSLTGVDGTITLEVSDNGCGLPLGFNADRTGRFGLMLVRMMSEQLGGTFAIDAKPGGGTVSTVRFPE